MSGPRSRLEAATAVGWWLIAFVVNLASYQFLNDHFGRISAARQIARYGEFPFRDFLDPGYILTEFSSAGIQLLFGDNLVGEMLWTSAFIATGAVIVIALARRVGLPRVASLVIASLIILAGARPYDFDKALFYPLGILLCWRYADRPDARRLWALAAGAVAAGMFRYDNGLFCFAAGLVTLATLHARDLKTVVNITARFIAATVMCVLPFLLFLQWNGGIVNAAHQVLTYARWEGGGTRLTEVPPLVPAELRLVYEPDRVQVRWAPSADQQRPRFESQYKLRDGVPQGSPVNRVWLYTAGDTSHNNLQALISDPQVIDTHLIDRSTATLTRDGPWWKRLYRQLPLVGHWTLSWTSRDAANWLYWVFVLLPAAAVVMAWQRRTADRTELANVFAASTMAACVTVFILRQPLLARLPGAAAPTVVLGAWLWRHVHRQWPARIVVVVIVATSAVAAGWSWTLERMANNITLHETLSSAAMSPPRQLLPTPHLGAIIDYVRRCTGPDDRIFAGWFAPELFFFSQRGFAGGVAAMFGAHWSGSAEQRRIMTKLESESVPVAFFPDDNSTFEDTHAQLQSYFKTHYHPAGSIASPDGPIYAVLARNDRPPAGTDASSSLPCFASRP